MAKKTKSKAPRGKVGPRKRLKTALGNIQKSPTVVTIEDMPYRKDTMLSSVAYTNVIWPGVDRRTWQGQRLHNNYYDLISDLGGETEVSTMLRALVKEVAIMMTISDDFMHMQHHEDEDVRRGYDFLEHMTLIRTLNSTLKSVGLERRMKTIDKKTLDDVIQPGNGKTSQLP